MACGILVLQPGTEPKSPALEDGFLIPGLPWKVLVQILTQHNLRLCTKKLIVNMHKVIRLLITGLFMIVTLKTS